MTWQRDALAEVDRGCFVVPYHRAVRGRCTCGKSHKGDELHIGKHPMLGLSINDATTDPRQIREWARQAPVANIGIAVWPSNLLALDADVRETYNGMQSLAEIEMQLPRPLPRTVQDRTPSGGSHFRFERPAWVSKGGHIAPGLDVIVNTAIIVPHSENKDGIYTWEHSPASTQIREPWEWLLEWLEIQNAKPQTLPQVIGPESRGIPKLALAILAGKRLGYYASRSEHEYTAVLSMIGAGFDFDRVYETFARLAYGQSKFYEKLRDVGEREARRWLHVVYKGAAQYSREHERQERQQARAFKQQAIATPWKSATDRATAIALGEVATLAAHTVIAPGERRLAEIAGLSNRGVHNALNRLEDAGIIRKVKAYNLADAPLDATTWEIGYKRKEVLPFDTLEKQTVTGSDVFRLAGTIGRESLQGLGVSAGQVFDYLANGRGGTLAQIVEATGRSERTAQRALKEMHKLGMVKRQAVQGRIVWFAVAVDLKEIARKLGTLGAGERQRNRHIEEREAWTRRHPRKNVA